MKNINSFVNKTYRPDRDVETSHRETPKMLTFEVDLDYVIKSVEESLKTDEAKHADNIDKLDKVYVF